MVAYYCTQHQYHSDVPCPRCPPPGGLTHQEFHQQLLKAEEERLAAEQAERELQTQLPKALVLLLWGLYSGGRESDLSMRQDLESMTPRVYEWLGL